MGAAEKSNKNDKEWHSCMFW